MAVILAMDMDQEDMDIADITVPIIQDILVLTDMGFKGFDN